MPNREKAAALSDTAQEKPEDSGENKKPFFTMLQGNATNYFAQADITESRFDVNQLIQSAIFRDEHITVTAGAPRTLTVSAKKLFDRLAIALTAANGYGKGGLKTCSVNIPLKEYADLCGKSLSKESVKNLRRKVKADLYSLLGITLELNNQNKDFMKMNLLSSVGSQNGNISAEFSQALASYLTNAYVMNFPSVLFRLDERFPSAYYIGRKLALHYNTNQCESEKIGVRSLLKSCPSLPAYESIKEGDRHYKRKIMQPFERALNTLTDALLLESWHYCDRKGNDIPKSQKDGAAYEDFIEWLVCFRLKDAELYQKNVGRKAPTEENQPSPSP